MTDWFVDPWDVKYKLHWNISIYNVISEEKTSKIENLSSEGNKLIVWLQNILNVWTLDTNVQKLSSMFSSSSVLISISGSVFLDTSVLHWQKSVHACPDLLQRQRLVEQFPENCTCNHNHNNIPADIKFSFL